MSKSFVLPGGGDLVEATFRRFGFDGRVEKVFEIWEKVVSEHKDLVPQGCHIKMVNARKGVVFVEVKSAVARHKIFHTKNKIIAALNGFLGEDYVKDIRTDFKQE